MEYVIVRNATSLTIRKEVDITEEEYVKAKSIKPEVVMAVGKDLKLDSVSIYSNKIVFCKDTEVRIITDKDIRSFIHSIKDFFKWLKDYKIEEPECPTHEDGENDDNGEAIDEKELEFVKKMLEDINKPNDKPDHIVGAIVLDRTTGMICPELTCWGKMSYNLLKTMCELYIKTYDKG